MLATALKLEDRRFKRQNGHMTNVITRGKSTDVGFSGGQKQYMIAVQKNFLPT